MVFDVDGVMSSNCSFFIFDEGLDDEFIWFGGFVDGYCGSILYFFDGG